MRDETQRDILSIIMATAAAHDTKSDETVAAMVKAIGDAIGDLNVAHAFALGLMMGAGGAISGNAPETNLIISVANELGDKIETQRAQRAPKGTLLN